MSTFSIVLTSLYWLWLWLLLFSRFFSSLRLSCYHVNEEKLRTLLNMEKLQTPSKRKYKVKKPHKSNHIPIDWAKFTSFSSNFCGGNPAKLFETFSQLWDASRRRSVAWDRGTNENRDMYSEESSLIDMLTRHTSLKTTHETEETRAHRRWRWEKWVEQWNLKLKLIQFLSGKSPRLCCFLCCYGTAQLDGFFVEFARGGFCGK